MNIGRQGSIAILIGALCVHAGAAQEITVAVAADLEPAMQDLAAHYQQEHGKTLRVIYGSSGNLFQQIQNGAPFDMFFSANLDYAKRLETAGLTVAGSYYQYARGKIALWVLNDSKIDLNAGLKALLDPNIKKIAIANPLHAPYGQAAVSAMEKEGIYDKVKRKFVLGENISQASAFVNSGAADIGVVALSLAMSPNMKDKGRYAEIAADEYTPIEQACVILKSSKDTALAQLFLSYIKGTETAKVLARYGFDVSGRGAE